MSFSTFSKEFTANMFTSVENQFITKYLPQADGDAVKAYLYGLYLCSCAEEFDAHACSKLLRIPLSRLIDIFEFWEECDLVHVLSRDPLYVQYLPVNSAVGKPKPIRAEKYAEFNRELFKIQQNASVSFGSFEMQKLIEFLEKYPMEQQALLLVVQYCAQKDGDKLSVRHILNAATKLCKDRKYTYQQVEEVYSGVLGSENDLVYAIAHKIDYKIQNPQSYRDEYVKPWLELGFTNDQLISAADTCRMWNCHTFLGMGVTVNFLHSKDLKSETKFESFNLLLQNIQTTCSGHSMRLTKKTLDTVYTWKNWGFSDEMILEAAKRSADVSTPIAYMNKLLSEWKREEISRVDAIPERTQSASLPRKEYKSEAAIAADKRSDREHYYAVLRRKAQERAEKAVSRAQSDKQFRAAENAVKTGEIALAKAEVFSPDTLPALTEKLKAAKMERLTALRRLGLSEEDFVPVYSCKKCSDTGFLPNGRICNCYREN